MFDLKFNCCSHLRMLVVCVCSKWSCLL
uniref:Uncharacterized protein n=1 Tax=Rhizophora mucronata TaxID=61149 RepID=A0A2P2NS23_RHIMU